MIVAGFGFRKSAKVDSLQDALSQWGASADRLASVTDKANTDVMQELGARLRLPVHAVDPELLRSQTPHTESAAAQKAFGTGSVAEAAALAARGSRSGQQAAGAKTTRAWSPPMPRPSRRD